MSFYWSVLLGFCWPEYFGALCVVHSWFHSVKMCNCCFCAFPSSAEPQTTLRWRQLRLGPVKEDGKEEEEDRRHEYEGNEIY